MAQSKAISKGIKGEWSRVMFFIIHWEAILYPFLYHTIFAYLNKGKHQKKKPMCGAN